MFSAKPFAVLAVLLLGKHGLRDRSPRFPVSGFARQIVERLVEERRNARLGAFPVVKLRATLKRAGFPVDGAIVCFVF